MHAVYQKIFACLPRHGDTPKTCTVCRSTHPYGECACPCTQMTHTHNAWTHWCRVNKCGIMSINKHVGIHKSPIVVDYTNWFIMLQKYISKTYFMNINQPMKSGHWSESKKWFPDCQCVNIDPQMCFFCLHWQCERLKYLAAITTSWHRFSSLMDIPRTSPDQLMICSCCFQMYLQPPIKPIEQLLKISLRIPEHCFLMIGS